MKKMKTLLAAVLAGALSLSLAACSGPKAAETTTQPTDQPTQEVFQGEDVRLAVLSGTLDALSPLRVLSRGYAMVTKEGRVLKSAGEAAPVDKVAIRLAEGELSAEILEKGE